MPIDIPVTAKPAPVVYFTSKALSAQEAGKSLGQFLSLFNFIGENPPTPSNIISISASIKPDGGASLSIRYTL